MSDGYFEDTIANMARFERASLTRCKFKNFEAKETVFEFADLRDAEFYLVKFIGANLVGASFNSAKAMQCDFSRADFFWSEINEFEMINCLTAEARMPEKVQIKYGPTGVKPKVVKPAPLYRIAVSLEERQGIIHAIEDKGQSS